MGRSKLLRPEEAYLAVRFTVDVPPKTFLGMVHLLKCTPEFESVDLQERVVWLKFRSYNELTIITKQLEDAINTSWDCFAYWVKHPSRTNQSMVKTV